MANVEHSALTGSDLHEPKGISAAAARKVYRADGAGSGSWEFQYVDPTGQTDDQIPTAQSNAIAWQYVEDLFNHGELYQVGNASATTISVSGTYVKVANFSAGEASGITLDAANDKMTVPRAGKYRVTCSFTMQKQGSASSNDLSCTFGINGTSQEALVKVTRTVSTTTDKGAGSVDKTFDLAASDEITFMVTNDSSTDNVIVIHANLHAILIGT